MAYIILIEYFWIIYERYPLDLRILCGEQRMRLFLLVYFFIILSRFQSTEKSDNQKYPPFFMVIYFTIP